MNLLFRTDASVEIGTGHVMRCLALAQAWQDCGGSAVFAMSRPTPAFRERLQSNACEVAELSSTVGSAADSAETIALASERIADWVVVDGYQFGAEYQNSIKTAGFKQLFLDDYGHARHYSADLVLNQNVSASETLYQDREADTRLLIGPRYSLLRREFLAWRNWKREIPLVGGRVLVSMGGSDVKNLTASVMDALVLARVDNLVATVVIGSSNPHVAMLESLAAESRGRLKLLRDPASMAELMAKADVAISAAGSTCWELCFMGLPSLLVDVAENQTPLATELDRRECAIHVGNDNLDAGKLSEHLESLLRSQELRQSLSLRSKELVDGNGARRVVSALRSRSLQVRRVRVDDFQLLLEWANDPQVREASFSSDPITIETHAAWFKERLSCDHSNIWIAEDETGTPCGQIRFDLRADGDWEVDVSVAKASRGRRLGSALIRLGLQAMQNIHRDLRVHAFVKPVNEASVRAFECAQFSSMGACNVRGNAAVHLVYGGQPEDRE